MLPRVGPLEKPLLRRSLTVFSWPQGEEHLLPESALSSGIFPASLQCAQRELPGACTGHCRGPGAEQGMPEYLACKGCGLWVRVGVSVGAFLSALSFFGIYSGFKFTHCVSNGQKNLASFFIADFFLFSCL